MPLDLNAGGLAASVLVMYRGASAEGRAITIGIIALLGVGLVWVIWNGVSLWRQWRLLGADIGSGVMSQDAASPLIRSYYSVLSSLRFNIEAGVAAIQGLNAARFDSSNALPRWLARIFLLLGLMGTVWGLGRSIGALSPEDSGQPAGGGTAAATRESAEVMTEVTGGGSAEDLERASELTERLVASFRHMETVFLCTLAGIIAALVMTGANALYGWGYGRYLMQAEEYAVGVMAPAIAKGLDEIEATPEGWLEATTRLADSFAEMRSALQELKGTAQAVGKALAEPTSKLASAATSVEAAAGGLGQTGETLLQTGQALRDSFAAADSHHKRTAQLLSDVKDLLGEINVQVDTAGQQLEQRLQEAAARMKGDLAGAGAQVAEAAKSVQEGADSSTRSAAAVEAVLVETRAALEGLRASCAAAFDGIAVDARQELAGALREMLDGFGVSLQKAQTANEEHLRNVLEQQLEQLGIVRFTLGELAERMADDTARMFEASSEAVTTVPRDLREAVDQLRGLRQAVDQLAGQMQRPAPLLARAPTPPPPAPLRVERPPVRPPDESLVDRARGFLGRVLGRQGPRRGGGRQR